MILSLDLSSLIFIIAASQGLILSCFLFFRKVKNQLANLILALLIGVFSVNLLVRELINNFYEVLPHLILSTEPLLFLFGPLIFFYTKLITKEKTVFLRPDQIHLIPLVTCLLILIPFYIKSGAYKLDIVLGVLPKSFFYLWIAACVHIAIYMFCSLNTLSDYRHKIKQQFSSIEKIDFKWLQYILGGNFIIWLFDAFVLTNHLLGNQIETFTKIDQFMGYVLSLFIYFLGYRALVKREEIIKVQGNSELQLIKNNAALIKYQRSGLTPKKAEEYKSELLIFMEEESPHLNPDITLSDLSDALSIPNNHLSQVINQKFDKNFFDFINSYRVQEAKEWLSDPIRSNETMLAIAFESGFKSKSTFNGAFKKLEGKTPSQYKKEHSEISEPDRSVS